MGVLSRLLGNEPEPRRSDVTVWEPTLGSDVPDGLCDLYLVLLDADLETLLGWAPAYLLPGFKDGASVLDYGEVRVPVRKKGTGAFYCMAGVHRQERSAAVWTGPWPLTEPVKVRKGDTLTVTVHTTLKR